MININNIYCNYYNLDTFIFASGKPGVSFSKYISAMQNHASNPQGKMANIANDLILANSSGHNHLFGNFIFSTQQHR
jgi:hypothetical protein